MSEYTHDPVTQQLVVFTIPTDIILEVNLSKINLIANIPAFEGPQSLTMFFFVCVCMHISCIFHMFIPDCVFLNILDYIIQIIVYFQYIYIYTFLFLLLLHTVAYHVTRISLFRMALCDNKTLLSSGDQHAHQVIVCLKGSRVLLTSHHPEPTGRSSGGLSVVRLPGPDPEPHASPCGTDSRHVDITRY